MKRINRACLASRIEAHAAEDLASGRIGGCAVLVQQASEVLFQNRFGDAAQNTLPQGSFGWSGAYGTHFLIDPKNHIFAICLKNSLYDNGADAKTTRTFEEDVYASLED